MYGSENTVRNSWLRNSQASTTITFLREHSMTLSSKSIMSVLIDLYGSQISSEKFFCAETSFKVKVQRLSVSGIFSYKWDIYIYASPHLQGSESIMRGQQDC